MIPIRRKITDLREERASHFEEMKRISDAAETNGRDLSAEETQEYEQHSTELDSLTARIERLERENGIAPEFARQPAVDLSGEGDRGDGTPREARGQERRTAALYARISQNRDSQGALEELRSIANRVGAEALAVRVRNGDTLARALYVATDHYEDAFESYMRSGATDGRPLTSEQRAALQVGTDSEGGYTVPTEFLRQLLEAQREFGVVANLGFHFTTSNNGQVKVPRIATFGTSVLTAEEAAYTESEETFDQVTMDAYKYGRIEKIADELVIDSAFDILGIVARLAGQSLALITGTAYAVGTGSGQPNGVFTAAATGKTAAGAAAVTMDELIDLKHSVIGPYRARASWLMKDATLAAVAKLKDAENRYLWMPSVIAGEPDSLLNAPVYTDPNAPAQTTGLDSIAYGDVSKYWIRDVQNTGLKVLDQLYAATGQVGFRVDQRTDGDLTDANAVKVLTQA